MVVESYKSSEFLLADGVEGTTNGLLFVETLKGAEVAVALLAGKDTFATADDTSDKVSFDVDVAHSVEVDFGLCLCAEPAPYDVQGSFEGCNLLHRDGCSGISLDATCSVACIEIAAEVFGEDVRMDDDIPNDDKITKGSARFHVQ